MSFDTCILEWRIVKENLPGGCELLEIIIKYYAHRSKVTKWVAVDLFKVLEKALQNFVYGNA